MTEKKFFLHIRFGLGVKIVDAKNGIFAVFSALAISKSVIISDVSGQTLVKDLYRGLTFGNLRHEENDVAIFQGDVLVD